MPRQSKEPVAITGDEFKRTIKRLGLSIRGAGDFLGLSEATVFRIARGDYAVPLAGAKLLRLMIKLKLTPEDVD
jgi:hypothetical protein